MRDHRKLDAYQLADDLAVAVYAETARCPYAERFGLVSQLRRSAVSVVTNIVEGSARRSEKEYTKFLEISFSSVREVGHLVDLSRRLGYLEDQPFSSLQGLQGRAAAAIAALMRAF
jgi:four helix bundle protein